jgi:hypothetical protein
LLFLIIIILIIFLIIFFFFGFLFIIIIVFYFYVGTAQYRVFCSSGSETSDVLQAELVSSSPYPNLGDQAPYL